MLFEKADGKVRKLGEIVWISALRKKYTHKLGIFGRSFPMVLAETRQLG
jgi:hypothetical protein